MKIYDDLHTFYVVSRSTSLISAAKKMNVEQSSISVALNRLEKKLNKKLLIRKKTGSELTEEGQNLYQNITQNFLHINNTLSAYFTDESEETLDDIAILTTTGVLATLLIPVIEKFKKDYPNTSINLKTHEGPFNFSDMNVDIGILPTVSDRENVNSKKLGFLTSQMFCSLEYIKKYGKPESLESLKHHKFIGYYNSVKGYKGNVDWHLKYSATGEADIKINHAAAQILSAEKGLGILAIAKEAPLPENMILLFPEKEVYINLYSFSKRVYKNHKTDIFEEYVKKYLFKKDINNE